MISQCIIRGVVNQLDSVSNSNDPSSSLHSSPIQSPSRFLESFFEVLSPDSDSNGEIPSKPVHTSDVKGPFKTRTKEGYRYFVTFIDDKTRHVHTYLIKKKSEVYKRFLEYRSYMTAQLRTPTYIYNILKYCQAVYPVFNQYMNKIISKSYDMHPDTFDWRNHITADSIIPFTILTNMLNLYAPLISQLISHNLNVIEQHFITNGRGNRRRRDSGYVSRYAHGHHETSQNLLNAISSQ